MRNPSVTLLCRLAGAGILAAVCVCASCVDEKKQGHTASPELLQKWTRVREGDMTDEVDVTNDEWRKLLTDEQYRVTRESATEPAFSGRYHDYHEHGIYRCVACGNPLFRSDDKFDSGSGWPSYTRPVGGAVVEREDASHGMRRTEVRCGRCGSHLGHVFLDGPEPTGLRYCINSAALDFERKDADEVK